MLWAFRRVMQYPTNTAPFGESLLRRSSTARSRSRCGARASFGGKVERLFVDPAQRAVRPVIPVLVVDHPIRDPTGFLCTGGRPRLGEHQPIGNRLIALSVSTVGERAVSQRPDYRCQQPGVFERQVLPAVQNGLTHGHLPSDPWSLGSLR
jgi:hypothetical protein